MIVKLLRQKGVLDAGEYRSALAEQPNIAGMQRKVDQIIAQPPVFASSSSAKNEVVEPSVVELSVQPAEPGRESAEGQSPLDTTEQTSPAADESEK